VAVKIKLKRLGKIRAPYYRIIVADARTKRDGRAIEEIGKYHPKSEPSFIEVNSERAQHWLSVGAQPTDPVRKILEITGDWQKFKGLPGTEGTLRVAAPKESRKDIFAAAVKETLGDATAPPKGKSRSAASKDSDTEKSGKAAAKDSSPAKADKPAKAKAAETSGKAKSGDSGDAAAKGKPKEAAKSGKGDAAEAQAETPAADAAEPVTEKAEPAAKKAEPAAEKAEPAAEKAEPAAEKAKSAEAAKPAAETADSGSGSGD
jgi:small subunit ribosomal protein S16